jgi:hypothetical protein
MTRLVETLQALGLHGEVELGGRWVRLPGERATVYVIEAAWSDSFYTWCDLPGEQTIERYGSALEAIAAGLRRARRPPGASADPPE